MCVPRGLLQTPMLQNMDSALQFNAIGRRLVDTFPHLVYKGSTHGLPTTCWLAVGLTGGVFICLSRPVSSCVFWSVVVCCVSYSGSSPR